MAKENLFFLQTNLLTWHVGQHLQPGTKYRKLRLQSNSSSGDGGIEYCIINRSHNFFSYNCKSRAENTEKMTAPYFKFTLLIGFSPWPQNLQELKVKRAMHAVFPVPVDIKRPASYFFQLSGGALSRTAPATPACAGNPLCNRKLKCPTYSTNVGLSCYFLRGSILSFLLPPFPSDIAVWP